VLKCGSNSKVSTGNGASVGHDTKLWQMAEALRAATVAADYKLVLLGVSYLEMICRPFGTLTRLRAEGSP